MKRFLILPLIAACTTAPPAGDLAGRLLDDAMKQGADGWLVADPIGDSELARRHPQSCGRTPDGAACSVETPVPGPADTITGMQVASVAVLADGARCTASGIVGPHHPELRITRQMPGAEPTARALTEAQIAPAIAAIGDPARFVALCRNLNGAR